MWDPQSEACCSLNHDITTQHHLGSRSTPNTPKSTPDLQRHITVKVVPYTHHTQHIKVLKHFIHLIWIWDPVWSLCCGLNNDITRVPYQIGIFWLVPKTKTPKSNPDLHRGVSLCVRVDPWYATQHIKVPKHFCIHLIWISDPVWSLLWPQPQQWHYDITLAQVYP